MARNSDLPPSCLQVIGDDAKAILAGEKSANDMQTLTALPETPDYPCVGWDVECDRNLLVAAYKHGLENTDAMKADESLCFNKKVRLFRVLDRFFFSWRACPHPWTWPTASNVS